jgi:hypothetical protein
MYTLCGETVSAFVTVFCAVKRHSAALHLSVGVFCVVTPRGLVGGYQGFGGTYCLHLQGWDTFSHYLLLTEPDLSGAHTSGWLSMAVQWHWPSSQYLVFRSEHYKPSSTSYHPSGPFAIPPDELRVTACCRTSRRTQNSHRTVFSQTSLSSYRYCTNIIWSHRIFSLRFYVLRDTPKQVFRPLSKVTFKTIFCYFNLTFHIFVYIQVPSKPFRKAHKIQAEVQLLS